MSRADTVARARACVGHSCVYKLGKGGLTAGSEYPWKRPDDGCDCSGFVAWALGMRRYRPDLPGLKQRNGGWVETTAMVADATGPHELFEAVDVSQALPGDVVVYGDKGGSQGHTGIVTSVGGGTGDPWLAMMVVHCSAGNWRKYGDAVRETGAALWKLKGGIVARHKGA